MIRMAIVEDEELFRNQLKDYVGRFCAETGRLIDVDYFTDGSEIVENYRGEYDLILMDIQMQIMDGVSAAEQIRRQDSDVTIMFITSMTQYALKGYEVGALDYVVKPVEYFAFSQKLERALGRMKGGESHYISFIKEANFYKMNIASITYVESQGHNLLFHTSDQVFEKRGTMKELENELAPFDFFSCNKGYLVNLNYVDGIQDNFCLVGDEKLIISRGKKKVFMETLMNFMSKHRM